MYTSEDGEWYTSQEIEAMAQSYAQGRLTEWMLLDALDQDDKLVQTVKDLSVKYSAATTDEAVDGLI
jgi:hypothetical protein